QARYASSDAVCRERNRHTRRSPCRARSPPNISMRHGSNSMPPIHEGEGSKFTPVGHAVPHYICESCKYAPCREQVTVRGRAVDELFSHLFAVAVTYLGGVSAECTTGVQVER